MKGGVFQINERHPREGWQGALVLAYRIESWGIQGFIRVPRNDTSAVRIDVRLPQAEVTFIGYADLPDEEETT